jgi:hypothetical protein
MPSKKHKLTDAEQSALFIESGKRLDAENRGKQFEKVFKKVVKARGKSKRATSA